jgi:hypothetical protein
MHAGVCGLHFRMECKATLAISKRKPKQERGSAKIRPCGSRSIGAHTSRVLPCGRSVNLGAQLEACDRLLTARFSASSGRDAGGSSSSGPPSAHAFVGGYPFQRQQDASWYASANSLRSEAPVSRTRSLVARQRSSYADRMTLWHALTHICAHRPQTAPSCPVWHAHHPLPVTCGPLQIAPITLHCGYWLKAPQLPAKSPHCTVCG